MYRRLVLGIGLVSLTVAIGAASCKKSGEGRPSLDVSNDTLCREVAEVACYNLMGCCSRSDLEQMFGLSSPLSAADCRRDVTLMCELGLAEELWALDRGTLALDRAAATSCLGALLRPEGLCSDVVTSTPWGEACNAPIWTGQVPPGGACVYGFECAPDSVCAPDRTCVALPALSEECGPQGQCASGLYCDFSQDPRVCASRLAVGEVCARNAECQLGLFCDQDATPDPICAARKPVGENCDANNQCETGTCIPGLCAGTGNSCFGDSDCNGTCANNGAFCFDSSDCMGTCDASAVVSCSFDFDCGVDGPCNHAACDSSCVGQPVCGENFFVIDYCNDPLNQIGP